MPAVDLTEFRQNAETAGAKVQHVQDDEFGEFWFFELAKPGPALSYTSKTLRAERTFVVWPYSNVWGFCSWQVGWSRLLSYNNSAPGDYVGAGVRRRIPQALPVVQNSTQKPLAYATDILRVTGMTPQEAKEYASEIPDEPAYTADYVAAQVTVAYGSLPYRVLRDEDPEMPLAGPEFSDPDETTMKRYVHRTAVPSARHVQFPSGALRWEGIHLPASEADHVSTQNAGRMLPYMDITYTWHQVPGLPRVIFEGAIGKVNSLTFDEEFGPETLLLVGVDLTPHRMINGNRAYDITYRFRHLDGNSPEPYADGDTQIKARHNFADSGHNYFLRYYREGETIRFVWDRPYASGPAEADRKPVFESMDFGYLFVGPFTTGLWVAV